MAFSEPMRRSSSAGLSGNISTVSSASVSSPRSDANAGAAAPREPFSSQVADVATGQAGTSGESHNVETGKDALKYLKSLLGDNVKLTAQLESLSSADRYMMDMVALNVLTAHKALGENARSEFKDLGQSLAKLLQGVKDNGEDCCIEANPAFKKLSKNVSKLLLLSDKGPASAAERGNAAAKMTAEARVGGQLKGGVRESGLVDKNAAVAQARRIDDARNQAKGSKTSGFLVASGTALKQAGATDQLLRNVRDPNDPATPASPAASNVPAAPAQGPHGEAVPVSNTNTFSPVINNNVNLDGLGELFKSMMDMIKVLVDQLAAQQATANTPTVVAEPEPVAQPIVPKEVVLAPTAQEAPEIPDEPIAEAPKPIVEEAPAEPMPEPPPAPPATPRKWPTVQPAPRRFTTQGGARMSVLDQVSTPAPQKAHLLSKGIV